MSFDDNDEIEDGFKISGVDAEDTPEEINDFGLGDEDPDKDN